LASLLLHHDLVDQELQLLHLSTLSLHLPGKLTDGTTRFSQTLLVRPSLAVQRPRCDYLTVKFIDLIGAASSVSEWMDTG